MTDIADDCAELATLAPMPGPALAQGSVAMTQRITPVTDLERVRERVENLLAGAQRFAESSTDTLTSVGFSAQAEVLHSVLAIIDEEADEETAAKMCPEDQWCDTHHVFGVHEAWDAV